MAAVELSNSECSSPKLAKLDEPINLLSDSVHDNIQDLSKFKLETVLQNNTNRKTVFLKGTFDSKEGDAVVILEKTTFAEETLNNESDFFTKQSSLEKVFQNDIYGDYKCFAEPKLNTIKTTIIHPATEKHINKYSVQKYYIVHETPEIYKDVVLPHLTQEQFNLQWVYNILDHKSETERIVYEDSDPENGFVLVPDLKWNGEVDTLYLLAIVNKRNIKSLRDLTVDNLSLLKNIKEKGIKIIKEKFGLNGTQLRIYFHYQPSFYHLHVHFCSLRHEAPGILTVKAHLLATVINNIELLPDYYKQATLPFVVRENDNLTKKLEENGIEIR